MASSSPLQSLLVNPFLRAGTCKQHFPSQQRTGRSVLVRCQAEDKKLPETKPSQTPAQTTAESSQEIKPSQPLPLPSTPKKVSTKFTDVLAFSGPAPERINGRLAMVGFVSAIGVELVKGDGLMAQLTNGGLSWFLYATVLLSAASLVPLFRGESPESKTVGLMTADAELWNGRFAMLGLVALAFTEYVKGGALV